MTAPRVGELGRIAEMARTMKPNGPRQLVEAEDDPRIFAAPFDAVLAELTLPSERPIRVPDTGRR
jgi:hypothetical protein